MKYFFHRDTIFATVFLFVVLWLLSITVKTGILEPGKIEPYDFEYTDLASALSGPNSNRFDSNIVIVNVGDTDRAGIAAVLQKVRSFQPRAVGLDLLFDGARPGDSLLTAAISETPNLVMSYVKNLDGEGSAGSIPGMQHYGFANFLGEKGNVIRYCLPFYKDGARESTSFAAEIVRIADSAAFFRLHRSENSVQAINYTRRDTEYLVINYPDLFNDKIDPSAFRNKIVLIGFYTTNPFNIEDKHLTPKNPIFIGRSLPDMHGVIIHANIISMMLQGSYIHTMPAWFNILLSAIIAWVCMAFLIKYLVSQHTWFHIMVRVWQSVAVFFFLALNILLFRYARVKIDTGLPVLVLVLSVEILFLYEIFALWLARLFSYRTIFKKH